MKKPFRIEILVFAVLAVFVAVLLAETLVVKVRSTNLKKEPVFYAPNVAVLTAGAQVEKALVYNPGTNTLDADFAAVASQTYHLTYTVADFSADELLTNGDFDAWSDDDPVGWSVNGEDANAEISEVGSNEGHGGSGTDSLNIWTDDGDFINMQYSRVMVIGKWY